MIFMEVTYLTFLKELIYLYYLVTNKSIHIGRGIHN